MKEHYQDKSEHNRATRPLRKLLRLALLLIVLGLASLIGIIIFSALAPLQAPLAGARPDPALLALLEAPAPKTESARVPTTSTLMSRKSTLSTYSTTPTTATQEAFELIPENELATPEQKSAARQFNKEFRHWAGLLALYEQDHYSYYKLSAAEKRPYENYIASGYPELAFKLGMCRLDPAYQKKIERRLPANVDAFR